MHAVQNVEQSIPPAEPGKVMVPNTVEEVIAAVGAARTAGAKLRCISHGHTWTPVFFDPVNAPSCQPDMPVDAKYEPLRNPKGGRNAIA